MLTFCFGERYPKPCTLVLGGFDGLHLGHRQLIAEAKRTGAPVVLTTMYGGKGKELFTAAERTFIFERAGVDAVCGISLSGETRALSAEEFLRKLFGCVGARRVVCGEDFRFGRDAAGTTELLKQVAPCPVTVRPLVKRASGEGGRSRKLAASFCKELLRRGELSELNACLCASAEEFCGGAYFVQGSVEHGREVGRTYGFPTLNLTPPAEKLLPPDGVYGGLCGTPKGDYPCIIHLGARPTFGVAERKIETYLDGFSGDLYGETVRVYPVQYLRGVRAFSSAEALRAQLTADKARWRDLCK